MDALTACKDEMVTDMVKEATNDFCSSLWDWIAEGACLRKLQVGIRVFLCQRLLPEGNSLEARARPRKLQPGTHGTPAVFCQRLLTLEARARLRKLQPGVQGVFFCQRLQC